MNQKPITLIEYPPLVSENRLIKVRGWTADLIRRHLGPPDALAANPVRDDRAMKVFWLHRVETAERDPVVIGELARIAHGRRLRQMIDDGTIEEQREQLADQLATVPIVVRRIELAELRSRALAATNTARTERGEIPLDLAEEELFGRSLLNYVRKHLVDYESVYAHFEDQAEPWQVDYLLRDRIYAAVIDAYPELAPPAEQVA